MYQLNQSLTIQNCETDMDYLDNMIVYKRGKELYVGDNIISRNAESFNSSLSKKALSWFDGEFTHFKQIKIKGTVVKNSFNEEIALFQNGFKFKEKGGYEQNIELFNIISGKSIFNFGYVNQGAKAIIDENYLFLTTLDSITKFNLDKKEIEWSKSYSDFFSNCKESNILKYSRWNFLLYHDVLVLTFSNNYVFTLNKSNGTVKDILHEKLITNTPDLFFKADPNPNIALNFGLCQTTGTLNILWGNTLFQYDLTNYKITIDSIEDELEKFKISSIKASHYQSYDDSRLICIGHMNHIKLELDWKPQCLVSFDIVSKKIIWQHVFMEDAIFANNAYYFDNKIYIRTSSKKVFVFEKI